MKYYCKFDSNGKMTASVADFQSSNFGGIDKLTTDGYIEITDADYAYYIGNQGAGKNDTGYVRGSNGKPTDAPAVVITKQQKLDALDTEYNPQFDQLVNSLGVATLAGDADTQASIKEDYAALKTEYTTKRTAIEDGNN